jgi:hypothetical protein
MFDISEFGYSQVQVVQVVVANPGGSGMFSALTANNLNDMTVMLMSPMIRLELRF